MVGCKNPLSCRAKVVIVIQGLCSKLPYTRHWMWWQSVSSLRSLGLREKQLWCVLNRMEKSNRLLLFGWWLMVDGSWQRFSLILSCFSDPWFSLVILSHGQCESSSVLFQCRFECVRRRNKGTFSLLFGKWEEHTREVSENGRDRVEPRARVHPIRSALPIC